MIFRILIGFLFLSAACNNSKRNFRIDDIPLDTTLSERNDIIQSVQPTAAKLQLESIGEGFDSFAYRFWLPVVNDRGYETGSMAFTVIDLSLGSEGWSAIQVDFWSSIPEELTSLYDPEVNVFQHLIIDSFKKKVLIPRLGMENAMKDIVDLNLQNAPLQSFLDSGYSKGDSRYLEFSNTKRYRAIHVACYPANTGNPFAEKVNKLQKLLIKHFRVNNLRVCGDKYLNLQVRPT